MRLESFRPGLVYEEQDGDFPTVLWLVLDVHEKCDHYVTVTELELSGPNVGRVGTNTISYILIRRYRLVEEGA